MHFVSGDGQQVATDALALDLPLARGLPPIGVKSDPGFASNCGNRVRWLQHARLVVRHHDGDEASVGTQRAADVSGIDQAARINWNVSDFATDFLEAFSRI